MADSPKQLVLLNAYEELTEKETFCLREANIQGMLEIEDKKAKLLEEMQRLAKESKLPSKQKAEFDDRVNALLKQEKENERFLGELMEENREAFRKLAQNARSASKIRKAYGSSGQGGSHSQSFNGEA